MARLKSIGMAVLAGVIMVATLIGVTAMMIAVAICAAAKMVVATAKGRRA